MMLSLGRMIFCYMAILACLNSFAGQSVDGNSGFLGEWCWEGDNKTAVFGFKIYKKNGVYYGNYDAVAESGYFIDSNEHAFKFKATNRKIVTTTLQPERTKSLGLIRLKILPDNQLHWRVLIYPNGDLFVPRDAVMYRCDNTKME